MKYLTLALILSSLVAHNLSAASSPAPAADSPEQVQRKTEKCRNSGGSIKSDGKCMKKGSNLQTYNIIK